LCVRYDYNLPQSPRLALHIHQTSLFANESTMLFPFLSVSSVTVTLSAKLSACPPPLSHSLILHTISSYVPSLSFPTICSQTTQSISPPPSPPTRHSPFCFIETVTISHKPFQQSSSSVYFNVLCLCYTATILLDQVLCVWRGGRCGEQDLHLCFFFLVTFPRHNQLQTHNWHTNIQLFMLVIVSQTQPRFYASV